MTGLAAARALLFVPGNRPDRFEKAQATGTDVVVIDLEDAVSPDEKQVALDHVCAWLTPDHQVVVRVNPSGTPWHASEVSRLAGLGLGVVVPKAEDAGNLARLVDQVGPGRVVAQVETPVGVRTADDLAAVRGVARLAFGNVDLAAALGVEPTSTAALAYARGRIVLASATAGLPAPVDGVTTALDDTAALARDLAHARELGFTGRFCLHPRQVAPTLQALSATEEELAWANRVLTACRAGGVSVVDGQMVDVPVLSRARALVQRAP
jgi:citrate lyase subunit beta/citryl-CoA lyase